MRLIIAAAALTAIVAAGGRADAYPQFQLSTETARCNLCHIAPAGGGLLNSWGRDEASDTISRGGDGSFLHGTWDPPKWLFLGGDFRLVTGVKETDAADPDYLLFPMQADIYSVFKYGDFKLSLTVGARGGARNREPPPHSRFGSREHYLMWQPKTTGLYVRAGRFYAPFGLRQVDHTNFIRRDMGFYAWEETYGLSAGYLEGDSWEIHGTAYARDPLLRVGPPGGGAAVMYEKRFRDESAAWGAQAKVHRGDDTTRFVGGGTLKLFFDSLDLLVLSELDLSVTTVAIDNADPIAQTIAHVNATYFIANGWQVGATVEVNAEDVSLAGKDREAGTLILQYFPQAHWEILLMGRAERTAGTGPDQLGFLMLHYYL